MRSARPQLGNGARASLRSFTALGAIGGAHEIGPRAGFGLSLGVQGLEVCGLWGLGVWGFRVWGVSVFRTRFGVLGLIDGGVQGSFQGYILFRIGVIMWNHTKEELKWTLRIPLGFTLGLGFGA